MKRVLVIVDGLNLMHALAQQNSNHEYINLVGLVARLTNLKSERVVGFQYFTAIASHVSDFGQLKQKRFLEFLRSSGVTVTLGVFHEVREICANCKHRSKRHIEKQTDVGVAATLIAGAYEDTFDKVLLFSADSDLLPAIRLVKAKYPGKEIKLVSTVAYLRPVHATMGRFCDGQIRLTPELLKEHAIELVGDA